MNLSNNTILSKLLKIIKNLINKKTHNNHTIFKHIKKYTSSFDLILSRFSSFSHKTWLSFSTLASDASLSLFSISYRLSASIIRLFNLAAISSCSLKKKIQLSIKLCCLFYYFLRTLFFALFHFPLEEVHFLIFCFLAPFVFSKCLLFLPCPSS